MIYQKTVVTLYKIWRQSFFMW